MPRFVCPVSARIYVTTQKNKDNVDIMYLAPSGQCLFYQALQHFLKSKRQNGRYEKATQLNLVSGWLLTFQNVSVSRARLKELSYIIEQKNVIAVLVQHVRSKC